MNRIRSLILIPVLLCAQSILEPALAADSGPLVLTGDTLAHDPSTVVKDAGRWYTFTTGRGIRVKSSADRTEWKREPVVFDSSPKWTTDIVPGFDGWMWAPDVIKLNGAFHLYYSVSKFGKQTSAIALATNPTLDSAATNFAWTDNGPVITSMSGSAFNTIDPAVLFDAEGKLWMVFGSYWQGIHLVELDTATGTRIATNSPVHRLAWNPSIEAACIYRHGGYYHLFVNWGQCCQGTNSTYEVRMGRSEKITGPYLDRAGTNLVDGGGSVFLKSEGRFIGPGHIGVIEEGDKLWISYHYYDAESYGRSRLAIRRLFWDDEGWPSVSVQGKQ